MESNSSIVLVSDFGRSGQGWLSYMLCYILNAQFVEPYNFLNGKTYSASKEVLSLTSGNLPGREKTKYNLIVKTHNYPSAEFNLTDKVIMLIRDPRDVAVSMHNLNLIHEKSVGWNHPRAKFFMVWYKLFPMTDYLRTMRDWVKHYRAWKNVPAHQVRYEDLLTKPQEILKGILQYLGVQASETLIQEAIDTFSFEKITGRKPGQEDKNNKEFRKGVSGDHKNKFSKWQLSVINKRFGNIINELGYQL